MIESKELITLIGIIVSLIVGFTGLYISFQNSKKTVFINSVTASRAKWIETLRQTIAEYCGLSFQIFQSVVAEKLKKMDRLQQLRFLIKLQLNRNDPFDASLIQIIDNISIYVYDDNRARIEPEIDKLINLSQDLLKLEWEGVKQESLKGNLSKREKRKLYHRYLRKYVKSK